MMRTTFRAALWLALGGAAVAAEVPRPEHPTPDAVRTHWANLNGPWEFRFDPEDRGRDAGWFRPSAEGYERTIIVPFPWESALSGIHELKGPKVGWYRRTFRVPENFPGGHRVWLRFGAVDYRADVWVDGTHVAEHEGGYTPFEADISDTLKGDGEHTLVVRAFDPTDPSLPTGKQVGWYTPASGIWQTVWLESRPKAHIRAFTIRTDIDPAQATFDVVLAGLEKATYTVTVRSDDPTVTTSSAEVSASKVPAGCAPEEDDVTVKAGPEAGAGRGIVAFKVPVKEPKLWSPESPHLYEVTLELSGPGGTIDEVKTYFGLRTIARGRYGDEPFERILLNGKPVYLRGALDQSFNPEGIYTAPSDEFLRRDIAMARFFGLNLLRIHIKPDEPRRLYWADRLGMMIMEDMPNTWRQDERARRAWEHTLRETVARDRNHPAIIAWVDFNETWGLASDRRDNAVEYKQDRDTQRWVQEMMALTRTLDPTRLVEDNSPCYYDHVEGTDLNSWHFYIDDHAAAARHVAEVVARSHPGSGFNYCPGMEMNSAPLINSEYGAVSAGGGDRDISWGFRDLTTLLRKYNEIQGYVYTELTDIEWEHNGFANYDRTVKHFGYDEWVPGMIVPELQQADFIGYDTPPAIVGRPGQIVEIPIFLSHYSDREGPARVRWWVQGADDRGDAIMASPPETVERPWTRYEVTRVDEPLAFRLPDRPFVGAVALTLRDEQNRRYAANFVNVVAKPGEPLPRVERTGDREVTLRFAPDDFARKRWSGQTAIPVPGGKAWGHGKGSFEYRLKVPEAVVRAGPEALYFRVEASAKAGREKVDWPERVNAQDYPQTEDRTWPSTLEVSINGHPIARAALDDDPADSRGVLSHLAKVEHGSYGYLVDGGGELPDAVKADLAAGRPLVVRFAVPDDARHAGGLALFGAEMGQYPIDPTIEIRTADELPTDLGVDRDAPVAIDTMASRQVLLLPPGDAPKADAPTWAYTTDDPGRDWMKPDFDASSWKRGAPGFGTEGTPAVRVQTRWDAPSLWLRTTVDLPALSPGDDLTLHLFHDEDVEIFVNGSRLHRARGYVTSYKDIPLSADQKALFRPGPNVIAVRCRQTGGGQGVDVGLKLMKEE